MWNAASIFKIRLLMGSELRKSLTKNLPEDMHGLIEQLEEYIKVGRLLPSSSVERKTGGNRKEGGKNGPTTPKAEEGFLPPLTLDQGQK